MNKNPLRQWPVLLIALTLSASVVTSSVIGQEKTADARIVWRPKVGQLSTYSLKSVMSMGEGEGPLMTYTMQAKSSRKITEVNADGSVLVECFYTDFVAKVNDEEIDNALTNPEKAEYRYTGDGKLTKVTPPEFAPVRLERVTSIVFPDRNKHFKTGDSWKASYKADATLKTHDVDIDYVFEGEESVGKLKCYKISSVAVEKGAQINMEAKVTTWIRADDGSLVKQEAEIVNPALSDTVTADRMKINIDLVS
jgi:hypothetical protein